MELTKLSKLKTNPRNPRTITDAQFERLKDSLLVFPKMLTLRPLATDGNGIVLGGNMRLRALKDIAKMTAEQIAERLQGMKTYNQKSEAEQTALVEYWRNWLTRKDVPTTHESTLTDAEKDEFVMTDNASFGSWDFDAIANEWDAELVEEWGVDVWQDVMAEDEENDNNYSRKIEEDDFDPEEVHETKVKCGDIWILGKHRLMCGDSTDADAVAKLMNGERADIAFTSPPYGVNNGDIRSHQEKGNHDSSAKNFYKDHDDNQSTWPRLIEETWQRMHEHTDQQFINIQMLADNKRELIRWYARHADNIVDMLIWDKGHAAPNIHPNIVSNNFEFIFVFGEDNANRTLKHGNFRGTYGAIVRVGVGQNEYADIHKAVFPVALPAEILNINGNAKSVLDLFGGTGTTMIAAEQLGRKCFMMELDPHYCTVIIARWEKLTGEKARKAG